MAKFLELTDFFDKTSKEYVEIDDISRIQNFSREYMNEEIVDTVVGFGPFKRIVKVKRYSDQHTRRGSQVVMKSKGGKHTCVLETPEEIMALLFGGK